MPVISGVVLDDQGKPVREARVAFASAPVAIPDIAALTNDEGAFTLSAPVPGRYAVQVAADGFAAASAEAIVGNTAAKLTVRLRRA